MNRADSNKALFLVAFWLLAAVFIVLYDTAIEASTERVDIDVAAMLRDLLVACLVTAMAGGAMAFFEVGILSRKLRRKPYGVALLTKTAFYLTCILLFSSTAIAVILSFQSNEPLFSESVMIGFVEYLASPRFIMVVAYWGIVVMIALFLLQVSEKFGQGVLVKFLLGRYHRPREERRIFMFLDLRSSTTIAERLGHIRYSELIQDCFYELTDVVTHRKAEIYQYVGDEVVLTWDMLAGTENANCLRLFVDYHYAIEQRRDHYERSYGTVPAFKAGLHAGLVTVVEIGEIKKELAYHGDVLNTAARLQGKCNELSERLLLSGELRDSFGGHSDIEFRSIGRLDLRGRKEPVEVYAAHWE